MGLILFLTGQRNRKGWFFHCIDRSLTRKRSLYYFEKRIVGLTDELRGKYELRGFDLSSLRLPMPNHTGIFAWPPTNDVFNFQTIPRASKNG